MIYIEDPFVSQIIGKKHIIIIIKEYPAINNPPFAALFIVKRKGEQPIRNTKKRMLVIDVIKSISKPAIIFVTSERTTIRIKVIIKEKKSIQ